MEQVERSVKLAKAAGIAEAVAGVLSDLRIEVKVVLDEEDFASGLVEELREMQGRTDRIYSDLSNLAHASDPDVGWGDERYRLANRGAAKPDPDEDRAQLEAIEGSAQAA